MPDIKDDDEEFDQLVKFLDLVGKTGETLEETEEVPMEQESMGFASSSNTSLSNTSNASVASKHVTISHVVDWFSPEGQELKMWCSEFATLVCKDHLDLARQAMRVNVLWKQPQLLRLHRNFDQIFQVNIFKNL